MATTQFKVTILALFGFISYFIPLAHAAGKYLFLICLSVDTQGSYASVKCQGNLKIFKVRELSGNFIICQGKLNFC